MTLCAWVGYKIRHLITWEACYMRTITAVTWVKVRSAMMTWIWRWFISREPKAIFWQIVRASSSLALHLRISYPVNRNFHLDICVHFSEPLHLPLSLFIFLWCLHAIFPIQLNRNNLLRVSQSRELSPGDKTVSSETGIAVIHLNNWLVENKELTSTSSL